MRTEISPAVLYCGSIVVLITTENEDGTPNIARMSSTWWLGHRCMLGLASYSQTTINLRRTKQCVLNLASDSTGDQINALASTTGTEEVPARKIALGYRHVKDKFGISSLTPVPSDLVNPPCAEECPVQMKAELMDVHEMSKDVPGWAGSSVELELKILRVHVDDSLRMPGYPNRIDAGKWRSIVMSFQELYGLAPKEATESQLAEINEELYRP